MLDFPKTAPEIKKLTEELFKFLKGKVKNTRTQAKWTCQNKKLLEEHFRNLGLACFFSGSQDGPEFLWDFVGYIKSRGILIAAESEWNNRESSLKEDFEKLLYVRSPLKLFMCRLKSKDQKAADSEAEKLQQELKKFMEQTCTYYSRGETFIIYCVWWTLEGGENRDIAFILQVNGEPDYVDIEKDKQFELVPVRT
jgi:hypothetical protein